jgi:hypothetical protein
MCSFSWPNLVELGPSAVARAVTGGSSLSGNGGCTHFPPFIDDGDGPWCRWQAGTGTGPGNPYQFVHIRIFLIVSSSPTITAVFESFSSAKLVDILHVIQLLVV